MAASIHAHQGQGKRQKQESSLWDQGEGRQGAGQQSVGQGERAITPMDPQKQRDIARQGGKASHQSGHAHEFNSRKQPQSGSRGSPSGGSGNPGSMPDEER